MRSKRNRLPHWNTLNVILLLAIGGLMLEHYLHLTPIDHKIALYLCVGVSYGLIGLWIKSNGTVLGDLDEYRPQHHDVYRDEQFPMGTSSLYQQETAGK